MGWVSGEDGCTPELRRRRTSEMPLVEPHPEVRPDRRCRALDRGLRQACAAPKDTGGRGPDGVPLGRPAMAQHRSVPRRLERHGRGVPQAPDTFFSVKAGGGLWRTDDAGRTWRPLFDRGPQAGGAVAASNPNVVYFGTGQPAPRYDVQSGQGVFRSDDSGL